MSPVRTLLTRHLSLIAIGLVLTVSASAAAKADQDPPADQARLIQQALLTAPEARAASGFTGRLIDDALAGRSCYAGATTWTCDAWFTTDQYTRPHPNGVAITPTADATAATKELSRLAALEPDPNRPGSRVLRSTPSTLIVLTTGFAVGTDLSPAVTVSVTKVQGRYLVMGSCQVQRKYLKAQQLRSCATALQTAQGERIPAQTS